MEVSEFKRILEIGLGRAILHLQKHNPILYRDAILYACTHNTAYDIQIEGGRWAYLFEVIQHTGEQEFYRERILTALLSSAASDENEDVRQLFDLAQLFAEQGDEPARQAIYDKFIINVSEGSTAGASEIVELDDLKGLLFVIERVRIPENDLWRYDYILLDIEETSGKEATWQALNTASANSPPIKEFVEALLQYRKKQETPLTRRKQPHESYNELKKQLVFSNWRSNYHRLSLWGRGASTPDLEQAAKDFLQLPDNEVDGLLTYLGIFRFREFPFDHNRLIELALSKSDESTRDKAGWLSKEDMIVLKALAALQNINHPDVRALALRMIHSSNRIGWAVDLLVNNYQEGDWKLLESITMGELDRETLHSLGFSINNFFKAHPAKDARNTLINLYEKAPCSHCRYSWVEFLYSLNILPAWMIEESKYDSNAEIRKWVKNHFSS